jgi:hypothetical protein
MHRRRDFREREVFALIGAHQKFFAKRRVPREHRNTRIDGWSDIDNFQSCLSLHIEINLRSIYTTGWVPW